MNEARDWMGEFHSVGTTYHFEPGYQRTGVHANATPVEDNFTVVANSVLSGTDIVSLFQDIAQPYGINATADDIRRSLKSVEYPNGNLRKNLKRANSTARLLKQALPQVAPEMSRISHIIAHGSDRASVQFEASVYGEKDVFSAVDDILVNSSRLDIKKLVADNPDLGLQPVDDLYVHRKLKGGSAMRRERKREVVQAYLTSLSQAKGPQKGSELETRTIPEQFLMAQSRQSFLEAHNIAAGRSEVWIKRDEIPRALRDDDRPEFGGRQLLEGIKLGQWLNELKDFTGIPRYRLTAYLRHTAHVGQAMLNWHKGATNRIESLSFGFNQSEDWLNPITLRQVHISPLLGGLCLLASQPDLAEEGFSLLERTILRRKDDTSMRRKLVGLIPLILPLYSSDLLRAPAIKRLELTAVAGS